MNHDHTKMGDKPPKTVKEMAEKHDKTQEYWGEMVGTWETKLGEIEEAIEHMTEMGEHNQKDITSLRKSVKNLKDDIKILVEKQRVTDSACVTLEQKYNRDDDIMIQIRDFMIKKEANDIVRDREIKELKIKTEGVPAKAEHKEVLNAIEDLKLEIKGMKTQKQTEDDIIEKFDIKKQTSWGRNQTIIVVTFMILTFIFTYLGLGGFGKGGG